MKLSEHGNGGAGINMPAWSLSPVPVPAKRRFGSTLELEVEHWFSTVSKFLRGRPTRRLLDINDEPLDLKRHVLSKIQSKICYLSISLKVVNITSSSVSTSTSISTIKPQICKTQGKNLLNFVIWTTTSSSPHNCTVWHLNNNQVFVCHV